jgi:hypothetical protein
MFSFGSPKAGSFWFACRHSKWILNGGTVSYMKRDWRWSSAPCGPGYYRLKAFAKVEIDSVWHKGSRRTGRVWFG